MQAVDQPGVEKLIEIPGRRLLADIKLKKIALLHCMGLELNKYEAGWDLRNVDTLFGQIVR